MKKLLAILLFLAMIVSLVSCDTNEIEDTSASSTNSSSSETTDTSETTETTEASDIETQKTPFVYPDDYERLGYHKIVTQNEDIEMTVAFNYCLFKSESLGEDIYFVRYDNWGMGYICMDIYIKNISDHSIYLPLHDPIELVGHSDPTEFVISLKTADGYALERLRGISLPDMALDTIELKPGEEFARYQIRLAPGEYVKGYYVDENGNDCYTDGGFRYYGEDAYKDGKMRFEGTVSLWFYYDSPEAYLHSETKSISVDVALTCLYTPIESTID